MNKAFTSEQEQVICERYIQGESAPSIARCFGVSSTAVYGALARHGVPKRSPGKVPTVDSEHILNMYNEGFSDSQIADKLNCSKSLVQTCIYRKFPQVRRSPSDAQKLRDKTQKRKWPNGKPSLKGCNNPQWRGGKTPINFSVRADARYKAWRSAVFARDSYTCTECGAKTGGGQRVILHADHIKPLSAILHEKNINTLEDAYNCSEVWSVSNGRTLCRSCHKKTPTYGCNIKKNRV